MFVYYCHSPLLIHHPSSIIHHQRFITHHHSSPIKPCITPTSGFSLSFRQPSPGGCSSSGLPVGTSGVSKIEPFHCINADRTVRSSQSYKSAIRMRTCDIPVHLPSHPILSYQFQRSLPIISHQSYPLLNSAPFPPTRRHALYMILTTPCTCRPNGIQVEVKFFGR